MARFGDIYQKRGIMDALMGISEDDAPEMDISNITSVDQLQNALKPSNDQRKMAFWQGLFNAGTALNEGKGLGAGLMELGTSMQAGKQPNQKILEQIQTRSALKKLLQKPMKKRVESFGTGADGKPIKFQEDVDEDTGERVRVQGSEIPYWSPGDPDAQNLNLMLKKLLIQDKLNPPVNAPSGYMPDPKNPSGSVVPIPGAPQPEPKAPTEGQAKAEAFGVEMDQALKDIDNALLEMGGGSVPAIRPSKTVEIARASPVFSGFLGNVAASPAEQKYNNAMRRLVTAKLRADSGATITQDEIDEQLDQVMPKATDSDETIKQKKATLNVMIDSVKQRARPAPSGATANSGNILRYNPQTGKLE